MTLSSEDIIRGGSLPTTTVPVCMDAGLTAEHEALERELDKALNAPRDSLAAGSNAAELSQQIAALEERMREHTVTFALKALTRSAWKALIDAHPPRQADDGSVDERDRRPGINLDALFPAMIRACTTDPQLSDDVWDLLFDEKLTDGQFQTLADAAWRLNRHEADVPFSEAASQQIRNSGRR